MSVTIETVTSSSELASIAAQWNALADRFKTPLLRHEWFSASAEAFCPPGKLSIAVGRSGNDIVAIAPLVSNPNFGMKRLELLGTSILGEPSGFLYKDKESLISLLNNSLKLNKPIFFRGLGYDSPEMEYLKGTTNFRWRYSQLSSFASPWIPIETSWDKYYATISSDRRSTFRRMEKRAKQLGEIKYEVLMPTPADLGKLLPEVFEVEMSSWKSRVGTALKTHKALGNFFSLYSHAAAEMGMLRIAFLRINDKAVAAQLLVEYANRLWVFKIGYDETYARCSPGSLLMNEVVKYAFDKQLEAFEMLGTNQAWLNVWPNRLHEYHNFRLYPINPLTIFSHGLELAHYANKKIRTIVAKKQKSHSTATAQNTAASQ
jgi:CelD/BcsL family acetyltransferase involved in cellulose biosynthesis